MAPRTRSGKGLTRDEIEINQRALRAGPVNVTGFPGLPVELLLEISSHLLSVEIPKFSGWVYSAKYLDRAKVLRALSQMCQSLRSIFLPILWQRIEACASQRLSESVLATTYGGVRWKRELATELVCQLEIVTIRDPTLAQYVEIVNVYITSYSSDNVMIELARCLALFPNLHTIQILGYSGPEADITRAFSQKKFPSVRTVVIPVHAHQILAACPNARHVLLGSDYDPAQYIIFNTLSRYCRQLETLRGFSGIDYDRFMRGKFFIKLHENFPGISTIVLDTANSTLTNVYAMQLAMFPQLVNIEIKISTKNEDSLDERIQDIIQIAANILRNGPNVGDAEKRVRLVYQDGVKDIKVVVPA